MAPKTVRSLDIVEREIELCCRVELMILGRIDKVEDGVLKKSGDSWSFN